MTDTKYHMTTEVGPLVESQAYLAVTCQWFTELQGMRTELAMY